MEWISSKELMDAMGTRGFGSGSAQAQRVCKRAHAGMMRAKAKRLFLGDEPKDNADVPAGFWFGEGLQALQQDWESGDFSTWPTTLRRPQEWRAFGVEWSKEDAEAIGVSFSGGAAASGAPIAEAEATIEPELKPKATRAEMQAWIVERINAGDTLSQVERSFRSAIPGKAVKLNRDQVREMYHDEFVPLRGEIVRPGKRVIAE